MKKLFRTLALLPALLLGVVPAQAADNVVLIELFTSQGCSSCPPADRNLAALTDRDDVLALSMHVDYWDYLGWRDTFARPEHSQRQYDYRNFMGARVVYTPQMVIGGRADVPGYRPDLIEEAVAKQAQQTASADITIDEMNGMLKAWIRTSNDPGRCTIWMVSYDKSATVDIARGENAGKSITYHNVVDKMMRVGAWQGEQAATIDVPQPRPGEGIAIFLQNDETGRVLATSFVER